MIYNVKFTLLKGSAKIQFFVKDMNRSFDSQQSIHCLIASSPHRFIASSFYRLNNSTFFVSLPSNFQIQKILKILTIWKEYQRECWVCRLQKR